MVAVLTGGGGDNEADWRKREKLVESFILPAVKSNGALPPNPGSLELLKTKTDRASEPPKGESIPARPLPETARRISGRTYAVSQNQFGLQSFSLTFKGEADATFRLSLPSVVSGSELLELPVGMDNTYRIGEGRFALPAALKGTWERDNVFVIHMNEVGNINNWMMTMTFDGDEALVSMKNFTGLGEATFQAKAEKSGTRVGGD